MSRAPAGLATPARGAAGVFGRLRARAALAIARAGPPLTEARAALAGTLRWRRRRLALLLPKGLYARALVIVIAPMVLLQAVVTYSFMERHYGQVTQRLSSAVAADVAAIVDATLTFGADPAVAGALARIAEEHLGLDVDLLPAAPLPAAGPRPFFDALDGALSRELARRVARPFWIDTVGRSSLVEIRVALPEATLRVYARRSQAVASNSHIFLLWMLAASSVLLLVAVLFLRGQIRPILRLADAAEAFGKGREEPFRPRGAREVRRAGQAFLDMKRRVERSVEQRTTMLNGVSHDLRTVLTRFRLGLALLEEEARDDEGRDALEVAELKRDVDEMNRMLEAYLAFARGDAGEVAGPTNVGALLAEVGADVGRLEHGAVIHLVTAGPGPVATIRPRAFKRLVTNLAANAARYGARVELSAAREGADLVVAVDDDGPGIPEARREDAFRPFVRLGGVGEDDARNQDHAGTGLGLAIARDIARAHGGDVALLDSPLGGLRARVRVPA